jgi:hypothetical protein
MVVRVLRWFGFCHKTYPWGPLDQGLTEEEKMERQERREHLPDPRGRTVTIGRIVIFRSRTGKYDIPAIVTATKETLNPDGVAAGAIPDLTGDDHVHLTVFTAGFPGQREGANDFEVESVHARSENVSGCYQEWDIPYDDVRDAHVPPGTWRWPERT